MNENSSYSWGPGEFELLALPVYTYDWISAFLPYGGAGPSFGFPGGDATTQLGDWGYYWGSIYLGTMASFSGSVNVLNPGLGSAEEAFNRRYPDPDAPAPISFPVVSNQPPQDQSVTPDQAKELCETAVQLRYNGLSPMSDLSGDPGYAVAQGTNASFNSKTWNPTGRENGMAAQGAVAGAAMVMGKAADFQTCMDNYYTSKP